MKLVRSSQHVAFVMIMWSKFIVSRVAAWPSARCRNSILLRNCVGQGQERSAQVHRCFPLRSKSVLFTSVGESDDTTERKWNLNGLQKETSRLVVRCHKKVGKAMQRVTKANTEIDRLTSDPTLSLEGLEKCPNIEELQADLEALQARLLNLNRLEVQLAEMTGKNVELPQHVAELVLSLEVNDEPPMRESKVNKKQKGPRNMTSFRLPYRRYYTSNKTEIRVGKQAEDNDQLSLSPDHRDSADWWMHAAGCPGSHVIIRCHDTNLDVEVVQDAAALAARQSKCSGKVIKVSMTRARDVKKPPGAKAGLVQLTGSVRTISVNMAEAQQRLHRLDATALVN